VYHGFDGYIVKLDSTSLLYFVRVQQPHVHEVRHSWARHPHVTTMMPLAVVRRGRCPYKRLGWPSVLALRGCLVLDLFLHLPPQELLRTGRYPNSPNTAKFFVPSRAHVLTLSSIEFILRSMQTHILMYFCFEMCVCTLLNANPIGESVEACALCEFNRWESRSMCALEGRETTFALTLLFEPFWKKMHLEFGKHQKNLWSQLPVVYQFAKLRMWPLPSFSVNVKHLADQQVWKTFSAYI